MFLDARLNGESAKPGRLASGRKEAPHRETPRCFQPQRVLKQRPLCVAARVSLPVGNGSGSGRNRDRQGSRKGQTLRRTIRRERALLSLRCRCSPDVRDGRCEGPGRAGTRRLLRRYLPPWSSARVFELQRSREDYRRAGWRVNRATDGATASTWRSKLQTFALPEFVRA